MSQQQLAYEVTKLSYTSEWETAKEEWRLNHIYISHDPETCTCGHYPIKECCIISNKITGNTLMVGNCCVTKFMGLPSDLIFQAVKRIAKDATKSLNTEAIAYAYEKEWINTWEMQFYTHIMGKRKLSVKQAAKKVQVNSMFLKRMEPPKKIKTTIEITLPVVKATVKSADEVFIPF